MFILFWQLWAEKAGFVIAKDLGDITDDYRMRVILADKVSTSNDVRSKLPNKTEMRSKIIDHFLQCKSEVPI